MAGDRDAPGTTRTDVVSRGIGAPAGDVWAALTHPETLQEWLPPDGMRGRFEHFDLRPGGSYRLVLTYEDPAANAGKTGDGSDLVEARIVDLVPGESLTQAVDFPSDDPAYAGTMTMTWSLATTDAGTEVEFRAENVPPGISAEDHAAGMSSSLRNLAAQVEPA